MKKTIYIITDWTGSVLFDGKEFNTFDEAWEFIYSASPDERDWDEYFVEEMK